MAKTEYEIVWKKGGWFEKGHFALIPKKSLSDKAGEALLMYIFLLVILLFVMSIVAVTSPILIVITGYQMIREKRYYAGLVSLLAIGYFYIDMNERWLTSLLFLGYNNSSGEFVDGLFGLKCLHYLEIINLVAAGLGIGYLIDAILVSKYGKKFNDDRITIPQAVIYTVPMLLAFVLSGSIQFAKNTEYKQSIINEVVDYQNADNVLDVFKDTTDTQLNNEINNSSLLGSENSLFILRKYKNGIMWGDVVTVIEKYHFAGTADTDAHDVTNVYKYDDEGNLIEVLYDGGISPCNIYFNYGNNGYLTEIKKYGGRIGAMAFDKNILTERNVYNYDETGKLVADSTWNVWDSYGEKLELQSVYQMVNEIATFRGIDLDKYGYPSEEHAKYLDIDNNGNWHKRIVEGQTYSREITYK